MGDKLHRREGNSPDHQLRPLNDRSVIKEVGVHGSRRKIPVKIPIDFSPTRKIACSRDSDAPVVFFR